MKKTLVKEVYETQEDMMGFYGNQIPKGTKLYVKNKTENSVITRNAHHWRFVFDTMEKATAHGIPKGNIRIAIWFSRGKWEKNIN